MNTLLEAARAVVDRRDSPKWKDQPHTAVFINALRKAIREAESHIEPSLDMVDQTETLSIWAYAEMGGRP